MRDCKVEKWLERKGYAYEYRSKVVVDHITVDNLTRQQIRLGDPVNKEYAQRMQEDLKRGGELPAIMLAEEAPNRYALLDGIHRTHAYKSNGTSHTDAYIVVIDPDRYERIRRSANTWASGWGLNLEHFHRTSDGVGEPPRDDYR